MIKDMGKSEGLNKRKPRCWEVDFLRGICMLYVSVFHFCYIGVFLSNNTLCAEILFNVFFRAVHHPIVYILFFISGISKAFTKNDFKRFLKIAIVALAITALTLLFSLVDSSYSTLIITFGVLHTIASCIIICMLLEWLLKKAKLSYELRRMLLFLISLPIIVVGILFANRVLGIESETPIIATFLVANPRANSLSPGDFFPIAPMLGFYIQGVIFGQKIYKTRRPLFAPHPPRVILPVALLGRVSLQAYLAVPIFSFAFFYLIGLL